MDTLDEILTALGVTPNVLSPSDKTALDQQGYCVLPGLIDALWLQKLRAGFEAAAAENRKGPPGKETGTRHLKELLYQGEVFQRALSMPPVLAAVQHVLQTSFKALDLHGRDPLPGYGQQGLHADWMTLRPGQPYAVVTAIWMLDDFTSNNGSTRIVPASHLMKSQVPKRYADPATRHPEQIPVTGSAGSVLVFNGHLWHSGTRNDSSGIRRTLQCTFIRRELSGFYSARPLPDTLIPPIRHLLGG